MIMLGTRYFLVLMMAAFATGTQAQKSDWLVRPVAAMAAVQQKGNELVLSNGLVQRSFRLSPNVACTDYQNLVTGQQLIRAVSPEARLVINGKAWQVGGLTGQSERAYLLPQWVDSLQAGAGDFRYVSYDVQPVKPLLPWQPGKWWAAQANHATGRQVNFLYRASDPALEGLEVRIHYAIYDGMPLVSKWLTVVNKSALPVRLDSVVHEILAMVEEESAVVGDHRTMLPPQGIYIESNYAFNNAMRYKVSDQTTHWKTDRRYTSQVNYNYETPCLLEVYPDKAPGVVLAPRDTFTSIRTWELLHDSYDRERRGLAVRRMYRAIAPWTTANPIFMHLVSRNDAEVLSAIDQCAATGYEALILSFGSHLNMEDSSRANITRWKKLADYAHQKGIQIGGYSLFSSRRIDDSTDVINPATGKPGGAFFGNAPCFGSAWGLAYRNRIKYFFGTTGFDIWENDGPYPGDVCASRQHPGHDGLEDSQWKQMLIQKELYQWLNARGVYINAPDWYFLDGTHKIGLGYREVNFSLSREQQKILNRQNIFDGTWEKTPSMSWGFVPLTRYQGGGPEAILEPLSEHLEDYRQLMMQYYGAGVQACYRGPRLYDTEATKQVVQEVVGWYKKHRDILNSDIIHLRRADGRDWDGFMHVNPALPEKGLLMLFNPTGINIKRRIRIPLYYTGLEKEARLEDARGGSTILQLNRDYSVEMEAEIPAGGYAWFIIKDGR